MFLPSSPSFFSQPSSSKSVVGQTSGQCVKPKNTAAGLAAEGRFGDLAALLVDQREGRAVGLAAIYRAIPLEGDEADAGRHQDQYADEDGAHHGEFGPAGFEVGKQVRSTRRGRFRPSP